MGLAAAFLALLLHSATGSRYGYFRDELYFIACSKHLAWGYVDQPPLVALAAWLSAPFHYDAVALRLLPALAAAATVWLAARVASELGARSFGQAVAAIATLLLPAYLLLGNTLTTTSFEPFSWTLVLYFTIRLVRTENPRIWPAAGAAFAFAMYGKYSMLLLGAAVLFGLLATPERRLMRSWWFVGGLALGVLLLAPNIAWQAAHGWPFVQVVAGDFAHRHAFQTGLTLEYQNFATNAAAFLAEQLLYTNPFFVPLWLAGAVLLAFSREYRNYRFVSIAFVALLILAILLGAKGYYVIGVYATLIAAGSVFLERTLRTPVSRVASAVALTALGLPLLPLSLPVLPVDALIAYSKAIHLTGSPPRLIQPVFAEEFGWDELAEHVAAVYKSLPFELRARTAVFADTYADAGALDFYGPRYGLPPAISAQNTYYLWGPRNYDGKTLILIGATQTDLFRKLYRNVRLVTTYGNSYKWIVEGPTPIYLCTDPIAPLLTIWPRLRWYGA